MTADGRLTFDDLEHDEDLRLLYEGEPVDGEVVRLDDEGHVVESMQYRGGIASGWGHTYYSNGSKRSEYWYEGGSRRGVGKEWHANGGLRSETSYVQGHVVEERTWDEVGGQLPDPSDD